MIKLHEQVRSNESVNEVYKQKANKTRPPRIFKEGDLVWVHLRKERFPSKRKNKLMPRAEGPYKVISKYGDNAYKVELPGDYGVHATFNVGDLSPYIEDNGIAELRTIPFKGGGIDVNTNHLDEIILETSDQGNPVHQAWIEWSFIDQMLVALQFPKKFRMLVMVCVTTPTFSLNLNGATFGFFHGRRGLRQGDFISPLLFTICMEYLSRVLEFATQKWEFRYHPLCKGLKLNHLLFADDLLLFCRGDTTSIMLMLRAFSTFSATSDLKINDILQISRFTVRVLPFRYLRIRIQAGRLTRQDSNILVEKVIARVRGIGAQKLSYAGRLTLNNSVLNTLHNYWSSIFLIPKMVIYKIVAVCRNYLWDGGTEYQRAPLVAWDQVCCSKKLGDHIYLKGAEWATYVPPADSNWNWRNICKVRDRKDAGYVNNSWMPDPKSYSVGSGYCRL
ncbi:uncharacterized protein LOC141607595 [Silene latifolia]|uniref:uncharacterized protein LOC141607595 n=1 Tax=Silene latifolia TaxID=37657 RepID=UPI003D77290D